MFTNKIGGNPFFILFKNTYKDYLTNLLYNYYGIIINYTKFYYTI